MFYNGTFFIKPWIHTVHLSIDFFSCVQLSFLGHPRCFVFSKAIFWTISDRNYELLTHKTYLVHPTHTAHTTEIYPFWNLRIPANGAHTEPFTRIRLNFLISTTHTGTGAHKDNPRHIVLENFHPWAHGSWEGLCRGEEKFSNMCPSTPTMIFFENYVFFLPLVTY